MRLLGRRPVLFATVCVVASCGKDSVSPEVTDPFAVDESGGTVTAEGGVVVEVPAGALAGPPVTISVEAVPPDDPTLPAGAGGLPGTVFDIGPAGLLFQEPVKLTFAYDPPVLTAANADAREEDLALFTLQSGVWVP